MILLIFLQNIMQNDLVNLLKIKNRIISVTFKESGKNL